MLNHPDDLIRCTSFPKVKKVDTWKIPPYRIPIDHYEEKGNDKSRAIVEAVIAGDRGDIRVRLNPDIQFSVVDGEVLFKLHPMDMSNVFKCMIEYIRIAWVTEKTYLEYMDQLANKSLKPGASNKGY